MNPLRLLFNRNLSVASGQITTQISLSEKKKKKMNALAYTTVKYKGEGSRHS